MTPDLWPPLQASQRRAVHHLRLREIAAAALAAGRACDLDVAAITLDALERWRVDDAFRLTRADVNNLVVAQLPNLCSMAGAVQPDHAMVDVWTVLHALHDSGDLTADSDPISALLEPLRCHGRLGADGLLSSDDADVDSPCQCFHPFDPACPPGQGVLSVGHHPETHRDFIAYAHLRPRSDDPPLSDFAPLLTWELALDETAWAGSVRVAEFALRGTIDAAKDHPALWMYAFVPQARVGFEPLCLDADGQSWVPRPDGRRKAGYRWTRQCSAREGAWRCGLVRSVMAQRDLERAGLGPRAVGDSPPFGPDDGWWSDDGWDDPGVMS